MDQAERRRNLAFRSNEAATRRCMGGAEGGGLAHRNYIPFCFSFCRFFGSLLGTSVISLIALYTPFFFIPIICPDLHTKYPTFHTSRCGVFEKWYVEPYQGWARRVFLKPKRPKRRKADPKRVGLAIVGRAFLEPALSQHAVVWLCNNALAA